MLGYSKTERACRECHRANGSRLCSLQEYTADQLAELAWGGL
jgi:hypothetical protein